MLKLLNPSQFSIKTLNQFRQAHFLASTNLKNKNGDVCLKSLENKVSFFNF